MSRPMNRPDPGPNPPEECWLLDWLEPEPPEPPAYRQSLVELLATMPGPRGVG